MVLVLAVSCSRSQLEINPSDPGTNEARLLRIEAVSENVIRIMSTPEQRFPKRKSLVVVPQGRKVGLKVKKEGNRILARTEQVTVEIDPRSGRLAFYDAGGKELLREHNTTFAPIEIDGRRGWSAVQIFESPADEAFHGLGQHQGDIFNYKDQIEELVQTNSQISIPFVQSSKGYGLLLDNYSHCRFGHPEGPQALDSLFDVSRSGNTVTLVSQTGGEHTFNLNYSGYVSVAADGKEVLPELWRPDFIPNLRRFKLKMDSGVPVTLKLDWTPNGEKSRCELSAYRPLADEERGRQIWYSEMAPCLDGYFIAGSTPDEVIKGYRSLTGKAPMMPRKAMGFWQSRDRYRTQEEILAALNGFRERNLPIDYIVMDWNHWAKDAWGSHEFEAARFPDPVAMVDSIHAAGVSIMISVWPKFYPGTEHYAEFQEHGWLYPGSIRDSLRDWLGYSYAFYDAYSAGARKLFWKQVEDHYIPLGIDAWWLDATEPNVLANTPESYRKYLCGPTALGPSTEYFNAYALMNARGIAEGEAVTRPDHRPFLLTRSAFAGLQRWSTAAWSGDIASRWEEMRAQITAGLSFSLCGIPWWTMDIGGYSPEPRYADAARSAAEGPDTEEWRELQNRWFQFGAFVPIFRSHGQYPLREPWNIAPEGHPAYASMEFYLILRRRLQPYIYSLAGDSWLNDGTLMRALPMDFGDDTTVQDIGDEYLFGPALLVAPVCEYGARQRRLYFPEAEGGWYCYYSGTHHTGGQWETVPAPYERIPLYVRAGAILPEGDNDLCIKVFRGADGDFTLYEDDGEGKQYLQGSYSLIPFHYDDAAGVLAIGARTGIFEKMSEKRNFTVHTIPDGKNIQISYDGSKTEITL